MISPLLSYCYAGVFLAYNAAVLAAHTTPLSVQDKRVIHPVVDKGPLFDMWNKWIKKRPEAWNVKLTHGQMSSVANALGHHLFKKSYQESINKPRVAWIFYFKMGLRRGQGHIKKTVRFNCPFMGNAVGICKIAGNVLTLGALVEKTQTSEEVRKTMEETPAQSVLGWVSNRVGDTLAKLRNRFLNELNKEQNLTDSNMEVLAIR